MTRKSKLGNRTSFEASLSGEEVLPGFSLRLDALR
jgi:hypothetical protein